MVYRRYWKKKDQRSDLQLLAYEPGHLFQIIKDAHKSEIICSKCSEKNSLDNLDEDSFSAGPYGLYFTCLKCKKFSSLKIKFNIDKDLKLKELDSKIDYFNSMIPKAQKNYKKIVEFHGKEMDRINEINKPTQTEINYNEARLRKLEEDIHEIHFFKRTSLVEDFAELIKIKDKEFTHFEVVRPNRYVRDDGSFAYMSGDRIHNYYIKAGSEHTFDQIIKSIETIDAAIQNLRKSETSIEEEHKIPNHPYKDEVEFLHLYCPDKYTSYKNFLDKKVYERFEKEHYKPLLKEKQKRINLLKKVFRLTNGYIYVLHNEIMPSLYKVGWTERSPEERAQELSATGLPEPFKVIFSVPTDMSMEVEKKIHEKLDEFRYRSDREFFKTDLNTIKEVINETLRK